MITDEAHNTRMLNIRKGYWRRFETAFEHHDRAESCEASAYRYFKGATKGQMQTYQDAIARINQMPDGLAKRRALHAAQLRWHETTAEARALFADTFEELMRDGEVSEKMVERWDALPVFIVPAEAA
ncbi:hypothetical protein [Bradyrhizobium denitrificans]|uniref:hypothetical protein n=1 Tax=Bradyrhizobium denitrificans TaxID=2734912 RepID=UPI0015544016|nr:hypothetical protein [Bradyrhizobium sp. LMG 8443]NPU23989.1 hypothetical protein [Bradyrhizobium sp. LMG 8443]